MKDVIIYGPPASGKFTIAKELSTKTGYKLFDNHRTFDFVGGVVATLWTEQFWETVHTINLALYKAIINESINIISTYAYIPEASGFLLEEYIKFILENNGQVYLVKLEPPLETLLKRVETPERLATCKMHTRKDLLRFNGENDIYAAIPGQESLRIDNSRLTPLEVANQIIDTYNLH